MAVAKKFGTFNGVFTPAILTILGVIMYMRLPSIVGQAGLYSAIGIILIAHIISVTTGLSVSSIATDKRVKTGGTYYMISRSLGLPIGGTLGLALFVGLSFSVSLYLIGFSESFLGFWGIEVTKNNIRLAGSIALIAVTIITFISTSLALKTQFFILVAIILSLVSIFLGKSPTVPQAPLLHPIANAAPFIVLFGIFFPAVTGFEAGVSMSGDLENSKKSIPIGTIAAISVGLIVYIGMAVFFSFRVSSDQLVNNPNILLDISIFPPLVLAGIWGATLSSALGSILGAPRILQAISIDKITPRFFGIGFGKGNEPRNALLLTFLIAEAGILVGELDVIARVVSMFFITTYGFLNLSCAIENWASPDFRPDFRVSKLVSILGSLTCLVVMIQLDLIAMIAASLVLLLLFFYLKRKELTLESGDTWEGIWSSVIRSGLDYLNKGNLQQRNWRPNIILFSGGTSVRPHLINLGHRLVDKRGILSSFDLIEVAGSRTLFKKSEQAIKAEEGTTRGHYARRVSCGNVYETMESISKFYGFSGLEPNTVLMGWGRNSRHPDKFVHTIKTISDLDYNLLLLSYDETRGFGKYRQIDIWWRGKGNMITFAASLCRFLSNSDEWQRAEIRFLMITNHTSLVERLHQVMNQMIEDFRIEATVKIINNAVDKKPFYEIIKNESKEADLIINGIPDIAPGEENLYVDKTNSIIESLGTVLLIRASSFFEDAYSHVFQEADAPIAEPALPDLPKSDPDLTTTLPDGPATAVNRLMNLLNMVNRHFEKEYLPNLHQISEQLIQAFETAVNSGLDSIEKQFPKNERIKNLRLFNRVLGDLLFQWQSRYGEYQSNPASLRKELFANSIRWVMSKVHSISGGLPETIRIPRDDTLLKPVAGDRLGVQLSKFTKRTTKRLFKQEAFSKVRYRALVNQFLEVTYRERWLMFLNDFVLQNLQIYSDLLKAINGVVDSIGMMNQRLKSKPDISMEEILLELGNDRKIVDQLKESQKKRSQDTRRKMEMVSKELILDLMQNLMQFDSHADLKSDRTIRKCASRLAIAIEEIPETWEKNHQVMQNTLVSDLILLTFKNRLFSIVRRSKGEIWTDIEQKLINEIDTILKELDSLESGGLPIQDFKNKTSGCLRKTALLAQKWQNLTDEIRAIVSDLPELAKSVQQESMQVLNESRLQPFETHEIPLRRKVEYYVESEFLGPLSEITGQSATNLEKGRSEALDVMRLLSVGLMNASESADDSPSSFESLELIVRDSRERLTQTLKNISSVRELFEEQVDQAVHNTLESINLYSLSATAESTGKDLKPVKQLWLSRIFKDRWRSASDKFGNLLVNLLYRQSGLSGSVRDELLAPELPETKVEKLLSFTESVTPALEVLSSLPFYYKHLFLGKPVITKDFWVGRSEELKRVGTAIKRYKNGKPGALAIIGDPGSGKSAFCQMIAARFFDSQKTWYLTTPEAASADVAVFDSRLKETLGMAPSESPEQFNWPEKSLLIIDDIGRWWHRRPEGLAVIKRIVRLIETTDQQCMVVLNVNSAVFKLINALIDIDAYMLDIIPCLPLTIRELQELILVRHHSTGIKLEYAGKTEEQMSSWALARMFTKVLDDTKGNVAAALKKWICCIDSVRKDRIILHEPVQPLHEELENLSGNQLMILIQLFLHTQLGIEDLGHIMRCDASSLESDLQLLRRAGILQFNRESELRPNPFGMDKTFHYLKHKGLL